MDRIEQLLNQEKQIIDSLDVPEDFETRLRNVLQVQPLPKRNQRKKLIMVAACILVLIIASQSDIMAYYGQRLLGYDQVMNGTLQELNKLGKGQKIGHSYHFKNGSSLTLDGIMLDENQLIAFYTIKGSPDNLDNINIIGIEGKVSSYSQRSSVGEINSNGTEIKYLAKFEAPNFSEKELRLSFSWLDSEAQSGVAESGQIAFKLNRQQAMGHTLKKEINRSIDIAGRKIRFESILASPTTTVIKGVMQYPWELAWDQLNGERIRPQAIEIKLIADGQIISAQSSGLSTGTDGIRFSHEFDALPEHLKKLQIQLIGLVADYDVNIKVPIQKEKSGQKVKILAQNIIINKLEESKGDSYLTISSDESLVLSRVYMIMDGEKVQLEETNADIYQKESNGKVIHTRTLHFSGTGQDLVLLIERMTYKALASEFIVIPVD